MGKILSKLTDYIVYSNLFISFCAFFSAYQTFEIFDTTPNALALPFSLLVMGSTFGMYTLQRIYKIIYFKAISYRSAQLNWMKSNVILISLNSALLLFLVVYLRNDYLMSQLYYFIPSFILSILYFLKPFSLRRLPYLKAFYISINWVYVCSFLPILFIRERITAFSETDVTYLFIEFNFIFILCVLFDIKDIEIDKREGIKTFPTILSEKKLKLMLYSVLIINSMALAVFKSEPWMIGAFVISLTIQAILIRAANKIRTAFFYFFLVDGMILLHYICVMMAKGISSNSASIN